MLHSNRIRGIEAANSSVCELCESPDPVMALNLITDPYDQYENPVYWAVCQKCSAEMIPGLERMDSDPEAIERAKEAIQDFIDEIGAE